MFKLQGIRRISIAVVLKSSAVVWFQYWSTVFSDIVRWTARHSHTTINKLHFNFPGIRLQSIDQLFPGIRLPSSNSIQVSPPSSSQMCFTWTHIDICLYMHSKMLICLVESNNLCAVRVSLGLISQSGGMKMLLRTVGSHFLRKV